jgi:hypothetical protein
MSEWICIALLGGCLSLFGGCVSGNIRDIVGLRDELNQVKRELAEIKKLAEQSIHMYHRQNSFFSIK